MNVAGKKQITIFVYLCFLSKINVFDFEFYSFFFFSKPCKFPNLQGFMLMLELKFKILLAKIIIFIIRYLFWNQCTVSSKAHDSFKLWFDPGNVQNPCQRRMNSSFFKSLATKPPIETLNWKFSLPLQFPLSSNYMLLASLDWKWLLMHYQISFVVEKKSN